MSLWTIVLKNVRQRALSSTLTAFSIALGVGVVIAILTLQRQSRSTFEQSTFRYELIVGPKGSALQLVLCTVFHMEDAPGTLPYETYVELKKDRRVKYAIPVAVGADSYQGFRIMGTTDGFFRDLGYEIEGRSFTFSEEHLAEAVKGGHAHHGTLEAVIGAAVARRTGLRVGSTFSALHGLDESTSEAHEETWTVVGVLKETGTPVDRAIFINIESFFGVKGHEATGRISAIFVKTRGESASLMLRSELNRRDDVMAVSPAKVTTDLLDLIGKADDLLLAISILVILVAAVSIMVSIYNTMNDRRRSIAIMRAIGARRSTVLAIILLEAVFLCFVGGVGGLLLGHGLTAGAAAALKAEVGLSLSPWTFHVQELFVLGGLLVLGAIVGTVPAMKAYRTDIADGLTYN